jgi:hypothetical protein
MLSLVAVILLLYRSMKLLEQIVSLLSRMDERARDMEGRAGNDRRPIQRGRADCASAVCGVSPQDARLHPELEGVGVLTSAAAVLADAIANTVFGQ